MKHIAKSVYSNPVVLGAVNAISHHAKRRHRAIIVNFHQFHDGRFEGLRKGPSVHTDVETLDQLLIKLRCRYEIMSLTDLVGHLESDTALTRDAAIVTIDDGYRNNLSIGLPIFQKHEIPVTLYVATGYIGTQSMLPMERIGFMLHRSTETHLNWPKLMPESVPIGNVLQKSAANTKICKILKDSSAEEIEVQLDELSTRLNVNLADAPRTMLSWDEVRELQAAGFEIGSHGVTHTLMTRLPVEKARAELLSSKLKIEAELGTKVRHFAFPNGRDEDFSDDLRSYAIEIGYESVASVRRSTCVPGLTSSLELNRVGLTGDVAETMIYIERMMWRKCKRHSRSQESVSM